MKNTASRSRMGLSILAGGLSFVGAANAVDLVIDGSYESSTNNMVDTYIGNGGNDAAGLDGGWTHFSSYTYVAGYTQTGSTGSGQAYLRPYNSSGGSTVVTQTNSLTRAITTAQIDSSSGQYALSAWFSTYKAQNDYSDLTLQFLDASFNGVGSPVNIGGAAFVASLPPGNPFRAWGRDSKIGLIPTGARYASITTEAHALAGSPDGYVDLVAMDVTAGFVAVQVVSATPANNASNVNPGVVISATLQDGTAALNTSSVSLSYDGTPVAASVNKVGTTTTVQYDPPGTLASLSTHTYRLAYNNTGGATANTTNVYTFRVAPWVNIDLGTPLYLETFDSLAEGSLPAGWSVTNNTDSATAGYDLNDPLSDAYLDWVVISRSTISNLIAGNSDYASMFSVAPSQVINGQLVTNLITGNIIFADSDRVNGQKQIQYLFTGDYNLSGKTNVYLSFHNIYQQNQDSLGGIEYSINGGTTWLPAVYYLDNLDILAGANGGVDGSNTFATIHGDVPNIDAGTIGNGFYGQYIGVNSNQWSGLGPFLAGRVDDDALGSMRVEVIRLAQADNQPAVRLRLVQVGTWSWFFGMDDFGLYSLTNLNPPLLPSSPSPSALIVAAGNGATLTAGNPLGAGPFSYQWRRNGVNVSGQTNQNLVLANVQPSDAGAYDLVVSNSGGSSTSAAPAAVLTVINPAVFVTGQWDFGSGNLAASCGLDLQFFDATVAGDTTFGSTTGFGIPNINGQPANVMHFNPTVAAWGGYKLSPNTAPNGGGAFINQYTLVYDVYYPPGSDGSWRALWQTDASNLNDADLFINPGTGLGISGTYEGLVTSDAWHRIAVAFDLTGPGQAPVLTKFLDGVKIGNQTGGLSGRDGRFAVGSIGLLFGDNDGDNTETYVSSVQFSNGRRPDAFLKALGGATASKIPGCIRASLVGGNVIISWTGGVPLEGADQVTGPWATVSGASSPYTVPAGGKKFFRPKLP